MALNHDSAGFLVGPRLTDDLDKITRELELLRAIRGDTQETVAQLGMLVDALSGLDSVTPAEPNRPPAPAQGPDTPPAAAIDLNVVVEVQQGDSIASVSSDSPLAGVNPPVPAPLDTAAPAVADPRVERIERERERRQRRTENARAERQSRPENARAERKRGADGRFDSSAREDADTGESRTARAMGAASESLASVAEGLSSGADNVDPSVTAAKELGGIVSPVMGAIKPLGRLFGMGRSPDDKRQRQNVTWYRRIWGELREGNKKSGGRGLGLLLTGLMSMLGLLLAPLRALARVTGLLRVAGAVGGLAKGLGSLVRGRRTSTPMSDRARRRAERRSAATAGRVDPSGGRGRVDPNGGPGPRRDSSWRNGQRGERSTRNTGSGGAGEDGPGDRPGRGGRSRLGRAVGGIGSASKGLLRKLPVVGALLGAGMFASAAMAKDEPNATAEERQANKADRWGTMGGVVGGVMGSALGMFGGPAGAVLGGMLGDRLGTAVGEWLSSIDIDGMLAGISGAWGTVTDGVAKLAADAFEAVESGWTALVSKGAQVFTGMADWAKETWKKASDAFLNARDTVKDKIQSGKDYVSDKAASVRDYGQNALNKVTGGRYTGGSNARKAELIKAMDEGGITDAQSKAALMANVDHESGGFKSSEENLNYSAKRLQEVFPKYYKDAASARADANNPEAIANRVYGGRMGNTEAGDGFKYRGRGDIQLTGKAQYEAMGQKLGIDLVNNPELASDPKYSAQIAVQHWKDSGANAAAARGDIRGARVKTNGGTNGLADVEAKYEQYLVQAKAGDLTPTRQANEVRVAAPAPAMEAIKHTVATVKGQPATTGISPLLQGASKPGAAAPVGVLAMPTAQPGTAAPGVTPLVAKTTHPVGVLPIPQAAPAPVGVLARSKAGPDTAAPAGVTPLVPKPASPVDAAAVPQAAPAPAAAQGNPVAADSARPGSAGVQVTPLAPIAASAIGAPAVGVMPIPPAAAVPVSPPANPGSVSAQAPAMMAIAAPAAPAPLKVPSYSAPAPDASQQRIAATPQVAKPLAQPSKAPAAPAPQMTVPLTQNLGDRAIAHAATGGIGMGGFARVL